MSQANALHAQWVQLSKRKYAMLESLLDRPSFDWTLDQRRSKQQSSWQLRKHRWPMVKPIFYKLWEIEVNRTVFIVVHARMFLVWKWWALRLRFCSKTVRKKGRCKPYQWFVTSREDGVQKSSTFAKKNCGASLECQCRDWSGQRKYWRREGYKILCVMTLWWRYMNKLDNDLFERMGKGCRDCEWHYVHT